MAAKPAPQIERKTLSSTFLALLIGAAVAALNGLQADSSILGDLPATYQTLILSLVPSVVVFLGAYLTPHTIRTDLPVDTDPTEGLDAP